MTPDDVTMADGDVAVETLCEEFFAARAAPASTHEEWLLRQCAQLMHREAHLVSVAEATARATARPPSGKGRGGRGKGRGRASAAACPTPSTLSETSTAPSTGAASTS